MKILIAMASVRSEMGGPSNAVRNMAAALARRGHNVCVVAHDDGKAEAEGESAATTSLPYVLHKFPLSTKRWQYSRSYASWIRENIGSFDFVLTHSFFLAHSWFVPRACRRAGVPYAIRPHGSLNALDLANKRRVKSLYLGIVERASIHGAEFAFCTSAMEAEQAAHWFRGRVEILPLGVDDELFRVKRNAEQGRVLFLARIAEKKGLDILIDAIANLRERGADFRRMSLRIAGDASSPLAKRLIDRVHSLGISEAVVFLGHLRGSERIEEFAKAQLYVLPSLDENFGISVAEALAAGCPVVITPGVSHAPDVISLQAGLVVERSVASVSDGIASVIALSDQDYLRMSVNARKLAEERFSWGHLAETLEAIILDRMRASEVRT